MKPYRTTTLDLPTRLQRASAPRDVSARVPRDGIAAFIFSTAHEEVVPAEAPVCYKIITDKDRIGDAAAHNAHRLQGLVAQGWTTMDTHGTAERIAREARARMEAAGVPRGTAVVSS